MRLSILAALLILAHGCRSSAPPVGSKPAAEHDSHQMQERAARVRALLEKAALDSPADPYPQLELAMFERMSGDVPAASRRLTDIATRHPKFARASYHLGMLALQNGGVDDAGYWLSRAAAAAPDDPQILTNASVALLRLGNVKVARRLAESAVKRNERFADAHLVLARIDDQAQRYDSALQRVQRFADLAPNPSPGYYLMGRIYSRRADGRRAEEFLRKAAEADPDNPEIHALLGRVYLDLFGVMRTDEAIKTLRRAIELNPEHPAANHYLGRALLKNGRSGEAVVPLQTALKTSPEPGPIHNDLAQALLAAGRKAEAEQHLAKFQAFQSYTVTFNRLSREIDRYPKDPERRTKLVDYCLRAQQPKAAELVLQEAIQEIPSSAASFYRRLAGIYEQMGREDLATRTRDAAYLRERGRGR